MKRLGQKLRVGDWVRVIKIPPNLPDVAKIGTRLVFKRALGKVFRIEGFDRYGHIELVVAKRDTIWIEPEFVLPAIRPRSKQ